MQAVYFIAGVVVLLDYEAHKQRFYMEHDGDIRRYPHVC